MNKRAIVLGLGMSGEAAARLLAQQGYDVTVVDRAGRERHHERATRLERGGVRICSGAEELPEGDFELCVVSPGIAADSAWVRQMVARGGEVISELELGYRNCECPLIAVTGTNGKTSLVKLLHEIFSAAGLRSSVAGNYGIPLCRVAQDSGALDLAVVEVSSFQLELVRDFRPRIGILLNVQPDHLNRHGTMDGYAEIKGRLFRAMGRGVFAVLPPDVPDIIHSSIKAGCGRITFGSGDDCDICYYADSGELRGTVAGNSVEINIRGTAFDNIILGKTAAAAAAVATIWGLKQEFVASALQKFRFPPHRMEYCGEIGGVRYINDSKATNLAALKAGVEMADGRVRLIAGGLLKEKSVDFVKEVLAKRVACVYLMGRFGRYLESEWSDSVPCRYCDNLENAVFLAKGEADEGDVILLSPGCASFDQFESYEERGEVFKRIVEELR